MIRYTKDHEYVRVSNDVGTVGLSKHAVEQLGDIVFVSVKNVGTVLDVGTEAGVVESIKTASDIFSPVRGEIIEINQSILDKPELLCEDPENDSWLFKVRITDLSALDALMSEDEYMNFI